MRVWLIVLAGLVFGACKQELGPQSAHRNISLNPINSVSARPPLAPAVVTHEAPARPVLVPVEPTPLAVPTPLASLGPYAVTPVDAAAGCDETEVLAGNAPQSMSGRAGWFWPSVVQTLLAHDHVFQLVPDLKDPIATARAVALLEQEDVAPDHSGLSLFVRCLNAETCRDVLRVLKGVLPNSPAHFSCSPQAGKPTGRYAQTDKFQLLPITEQGQPTIDSESACARLSACARHENERADPRLESQCNAAPTRYPLACAVQLTCYDVAACAKWKTSSGPIFSPFFDLNTQLDARGVRVARGLSVADLEGGGGLDPNQVSVWFEGVGDQQRGTWVTLLMSLAVGGRNKAEGYYTTGAGTWAVGFIQPNGVVLLGPPQRFAATTYNAVGLPGGMRSGDAFDFDGDGWPELILPTSSAEHANSGVVGYQIWTIHAAELRRYPGTERLPIVAVEDMDNDGRPDLILDLHPSFNEQGVHSSITGPWQLAHSLADGTFSTTDIVARNYRSP